VAHPSARGTTLGVVDALEKETLVNNALDDDMDDVNVLEYVAVDEPEVRIVVVELKAVEPDVELALCSVLLGVGEGGYTGYTQLMPMEHPRHSL
jgi:hypothetical protein